eukprot:1154432-Pelagomonas_calceolata.AAC.7
MKQWSAFAHLDDQEPQVKGLLPITCACITCAFITCVMSGPKVRPTPLSSFSRRPRSMTGSDHSTSAATAEEPLPACHQKQRQKLCSFSLRPGAVTDAVQGLTTAHH